MAEIKHVGRLKSNQRKVLVAYRTVPGDANSALVVPTENLLDSDHDIAMQLVESSSGQSAYELAEAMARTRLSDGSIMLAKFHTMGKLIKVPTSDVEMTPTTTDVISLDELNKIIAEQKGVALEDLALKDESQPVATVTETPSPAPVAEAPKTTAPAGTDAPMTDEDLAASYRSQADTMFKEAKRLREQAEELVPTKKKAKA